MRIKNKKTGEVIDVPENQLGNYGIQQTQPSTAVSTATSNLSGGMTPQQAMVAQILFPKQAGVINSAYNIQQESDKQAKEQAKLDEQKAAANELKNNALTVAQELKSSNYGGISGLKNIGLLFPGTKTQGTLNKYKQLKSLLSLDNIKYLKGTGQISDAEQKLLQEAATSLEQNLSDKDFGVELDKIINNLGGNPTDTTSGDSTGFLDTAKNQVMNDKQRNPLLNFLLGSVLNTTQDIAQGANVKAHQDAVDKTLAQIPDLMNEYKTTKDPQQKAQLETYINSLLDTTMAENNTDIAGFSKDVNMNPAVRGLLTGADITAVAELPTVIKGILKLGSKTAGKKATEEAITTIAKESGNDVVSKGLNVAEKARQATPGAYFGKKQAQAAAESTVKLGPERFVEAGENLVKKNPAVKSVLEKQKPALENIKSIPDLLDHMKEWGDVTYKVSGGAKSSEKARLYNEFYKTGLNILKTEAPEVYKNRQILRYIHELPRDTGKVLWKLFLGRAALGGLGN